MLRMKSLLSVCVAIKIQCVILYVRNLCALIAREVVQRLDTLTEGGSRDEFSSNVMFY